MNSLSASSNCLANASKCYSKCHFFCYGKPVSAIDVDSAKGGVDPGGES